MSSGSTSLERAHAAVVPSDGGRPGPAASGAGVLGVPSEARQMDLLRNEDGKLPSNVFRLTRQEPEKARGPGRPKGAGSKRSKALAELIGHKYGDPVEFQASIYAMPLDQLCELILIADGTRERAEKLDAMLGDLSQRIRELAAASKASGLDNRESIERLAEACEALESVTRRGAGKPGDIALKALNLQLAAARTVSEYVHSKKPVEVKHDLGADMVLVMPAAGQRADFDAIDEGTRQASDIIARALTKGEITPEMLAGLQLHEGQLVPVQDAEFVEVDDAEGAGE